MFNPMQNVLCHYETLRVARDAPAAVIKAAYRSLSQKHHPDKNSGSRDAERVMARLNLAYSVLSDANQRERYDLQSGHGLRAGVQEGFDRGHSPGRAENAAPYRGNEEPDGGPFLQRMGRHGAGRIAGLFVGIVAVLVAVIFWMVWRENRQMLLLEQAAIQVAGQALAIGPAKVTASNEPLRSAASSKPDPALADRDAPPVPEPAASQSASAAPSPLHGTSPAAKASEFARPSEASNPAESAAAAKPVERAGVAASADAIPPPAPNAPAVMQAGASRSQAVAEHPAAPEPAPGATGIMSEASRVGTAPGVSRHPAEAGPASRPIASGANAPLRRAVPADPRACTLPAYPKNAYKNGESGTVRLALLIGSDGRVLESRVQRSSGSNELNKAAREALSRCLFKVTGSDGGMPVWTTMEYVFSLD
jgi:TonB family protein